MTLATLTVRNLSRNTFRVGLTVTGVAIAIIAFLLLRTVMWAWAAGPESAPKDRIVTRHRITLALPLPKKYVAEIRHAPHVKAATWANLFVGRDPRHDTEIFATLAIDPATYFTVYDEMHLSAAELDRFQHDKQGAVIGDLLAKRMGWSVGDKVILQSGIIPGDWQFNIDGIYTVTAQTVDRASFLFDYDYVNDAIPADRRDGVGWIVSRVDDPIHAAELSVQLDRMFDESDTQTRSQDERSFNASFLGMFSAILRAVNLVSVVILAIMTLILGNTIAMGVRERTGEYAVMRAIGFLPGHIALWVVGEAIAMGALGGALGVVAAWPLIDVVVARIIDDHMSSFFPYFGLRMSHMAVAMVCSALLAAAASAIPAWQASKLQVVEAIRRVA
jgi:putative ABC transport system permease protein